MKSFKDGRYETSSSIPLGTPGNGIHMIVSPPPNVSRNGYQFVDANMKDKLLRPLRSGARAPTMLLLPEMYALTPFSPKRWIQNSTTSGSFFGALQAIASRSLFLFLKQGQQMSW